MSETADGHTYHVEVVGMVEQDAPSPTHSSFKLHSSLPNSPRGLGLRYSFTQYPCPRMTPYDRWTTSLLVLISLLINGKSPILISLTNPKKHATPIQSIGTSFLLRSHRLLQLLKVIGERGCLLHQAQLRFSKNVIFSHPGTEEWKDILFRCVWNHSKFLTEPRKLIPSYRPIL